MEKHRVTYDTIAIMENYDFDQPIKTSIIYEEEDYDIKPNHITDPEENNLISTNLEKNNEILSHAVNQSDLCTINGTMHSTDISVYHRLYDSETEITKRGFNSCHKYIPKSTMNKYPYMTNPLINGRKANINSNLAVKKSVLYNTNINETVFLNQVAENLAFIIEDYVTYYNFSYTSSNKQHVALLKSQCLLRKLHYFKKCSIFEELLIQHENNMLFIRRLTTKVVQFAKVTFPDKLLLILFKDLLEWIKLNKNQKTNNFQQNPIPNETLPTESYLPISNVCLENGNYNHQLHNKSYSNIFLHGPSGSRITLNNDPQILIKQSTESNTYQEFHTTETNVSNQNLHNPLLAKSSNIEMTHSTEHHIPRAYNAFINESNQHNIQPTTSSTTPLNFNSIYFADSRLNHCNDIYDNYNNINNSSSYLDVNHINTQDTTRNSISRDSGFMSPVTSISPSESMYKSIRNNNLYASSQGIHDTSIFYVPNTTTTQTNIGHEALPELNDVQPYP